MLELRFNPNRDPKTGRFTFGDGSSDSSGGGSSSASSGSSSSGGSWKDKVSKMRSDFGSKTDAEKAKYLVDEYFLSPDDANQAIKDGTLDQKADQYFKILRKNGDPTPTKATRNNENRLDAMLSEVHKTDPDYIFQQNKVRQRDRYEREKIELIKKDTGVENIGLMYDQINEFTGGDYEMAYTGVINDYIEKAPAYDGIMYRGMKFSAFKRNEADYDNFASLNVGDRFGMRDYKNSSWSSDKSIAKQFAGADEALNIMENNKATKSVIITNVKNKTSVPIADVSVFPNESEVVAHSDTKWTVIRKEETVRSELGGKILNLYVIEVGNNE